ncbi:MAG: hypothetical protein AAF810_04975 [Cyanobacteria bacterium P01_D01_bin.36]
MPVNPKSLENLIPGQSPGRGQRWGEPTNKQINAKVTASTKARVGSEDDPFKYAGYSGISEFVEMAFRGLIELPKKPSP